MRRPAKGAEQHLHLSAPGFRIEVDGEEVAPYAANLVLVDGVPTRLRVHYALAGPSDLTPFRMGVREIPIPPERAARIRELAREAFRLLDEAGRAALEPEITTTP